MSRPLKPKPAISVRPVMISPDNAFALLGVTPRVFREAIVPRCHGVARVTPRLPLVRVEEVERVLAELAAVEVEHENNETAPANDPPDSDAMTGDDVLAELGFRRTRAGATR